MFTGLIEGTGRIASRGASHLSIRPDFPLEPERGDSIAVNGCCLTLERRTADGALEFFTLAETLGRTALGALPVGAPVNLERALAVGSRLDGHLVQGHVDAALEVLALGRDAGNDTVLRIELPREFADLAVEKGSIAVDGVSLTVAALDETSFSVCLIPETWKRTALSFLRAGNRVNIEFDILGKYVRRQLECRSKERREGTLTWETLSSAGFL